MEEKRNSFADFESTLLSKGEKMTKNETNNIFKEIAGKTIAIVYIFEGENAPGFDHYHIWKSDVISGWINAVQTLHCMPLILDVRTFIEKAINNTLPQIDYVLNLNCGSCELSPMGLVPSMCGFLAIPCIPCDTVSIVAGENKHIANLVSSALQLNVPKYLNEDDDNGIFRPLNYGSSTGVKRGKYSKGKSTKGVYQEFIKGFDITTPMLFNPLSRQMELMPTIIILPEVTNVEWYYGENENYTGEGFYKKILPQFSETIIEKYRSLAESLNISTYCRIDARIKCTEEQELKDILINPLEFSKLFFVEINPMPSIRLNNNDFLLSFNSLNNSYGLKKCIDLLDEIVGNTNLNTLLLACSMLAYK